MTVILFTGVPCGSPSSNNMFAVNILTGDFYDALYGRWHLVSGKASSVTSIFSRQGDVVSATGDYDFSQISGLLGMSQLPSPIDTGTF